MFDVSLACKELGVNPSQIRGVEPQHVRALLTQAYRIRARALHSDVSSSGEDFSLSKLMDAKGVLLDDDDAISSLTSGHHVDPMDERVEHARADIQRTQEEQQRCSELLVQMMIPVGGRSEGIDIRSMPHGEFLLYDYLGVVAKERPWRGRERALSADIAREAYRNGESDEVNCQEACHTFHDPLQVIHLSFSPPSLLGGTERRALGFLYLSDLWGEILSVSREHDRPLQSLCSRMSGKECRRLFPYLSPSLSLPTDPQVGIFLLSQSQTSRGFWYHIEGEVLSFEEGGPSD